MPNSGNCSENWTRSNGFDSQPTDLAYVIYTSGSTGRPKGVAVEHAQLVNFLYHMYNRYDKKIDANDRCLSLTNMMFDVSVWEYFLSLAFGAGIVVLPEEKRFDPAALAAALLDERITMAYIPPGLLTPVYEHLEKERGRVYLDKLLVGVEPIRGGVLENYMKLKPAMRIVNGYGPTETTICASSTNYRPGMPGNEIVPIGAPLDNNRIVLLDTSNNLSPWGIPGEICVSGAGVTRGYLNNPELTAEKYPQHPFYENTRMYRTGDLARLLPDGNLRFIGRRDHQLKIRGYRVELGEIEQRLLKHDAVQQALVIARTHDRTGKYLCAYVIAAAGQTVPESAELRKFLGRDLPDYMIPSYFVPIESIPLTPNGKVDTAALPEPAVGTGTAEFREARDAVERKLATIWAEVLDLNTPPGIDDDFFELGGHSLKATSLVHQVKKEFEVEIEIKDVFTGPTIREMAENVKNAEGAEFHAIPVQESREYYPLSYAQRRLWIICQFEDESTVYHLPNAFTVTGDFRVDAFEQAIAAVIQRHDSFRTVFPTIDGEPRQHILSHMPVDLGLEDIGEHAHENLDQYVRGQYIAFTKEPFNLETGPLMRFKVVTLPDRSRVVFLNIHHIITDGWSQGILLNELVYLYNAFAAENNDKKSPLPPLTLQYKDYSHWHNHLVGGGAFMEAEKYWLDKFKDKPNGIELPLDYPRKSRQTFEGYTLVFRIDAPTVQKLRELNAAQDSTLFMSLLALFNIFLYRYTGQSDIILGSPIAGRRHWELHEIIGFLVNTLVYRTSVEPGESFSQQLQRVKQETLDSYKYQDYPFDLLVDKLKPDRDLSQSPLFNVMLAHNNADVMDAALEMTGVEIENYGGRNDFNMSLFDLILFVVEDGDELEGSIMYNSDLFQRATIERMIENFLQLVRRVLEAPDKNISRLDILDEEQRRTVVETFNQSQYSFPEVTLQQMFEDQAERHPLRTAVVSREHRGPGENRVKHDAVHLTYDQLNREANQLANYLKQRFNITPNQVIGVSFDRSVRMVAVLLGIIKAGAGYLAVDPAYPRERVLHILADSDTDVLIIDKMRPELFSGYHGEILNVVDMWDEIAVSGPGNPPSINRPTDILYVNYTSGSTGTPNGAMLSHDCLTNLIKWQNTRTTIDCSLKCLQFTSINFCVSFQEIAGTLTAGGQLYLIGEIERQDIDYLMDFLARSRIEILFLPFSYLNFLFNESDRWNRLFQHNLKHIITAGEQLKVTAGFKKFLDANPVIQVHNHYGSTEMHVVTSYTLDASNAAQTPIPPAGKPISNIGIYILDEGMNPVPVGVWGELFVKGDTEILGYIRNQELTGAKLVHHSQLSQPGNIRLYRSGDIGRWMPDGNIELRGRKDFMVKIRGFRIELGEVESKILAIEKVKECVVVPREDGAGRKELFAYISVEGIEPLEIKRRIGDELPQYMIPQLIVMDALPLMPNGKVDRGQLPEPDFSAKDKREIVPPSNDIENTLVRIWAGLLDAEPETIGIDDNFFDLGGHSLKATTMMSKIHKELDVKIDLADIFKSQTIREIGDLIRTIKLAAETETAPQTAGTEEEIVEMIL